MGKFLGINNALLSLFESTINKFDPAPEVTGAFAAASLGILGMPQRALSGLKNFLVDRLNEEMEKEDGDYTEVL